MFIYARFKTEKKSMWDSGKIDIKFKLDINELGSYGIVFSEQITIIDDYYIIITNKIPAAFLESIKKTFINAGILMPLIDIYMSKRVQLTDLKREIDDIYTVTPMPGLRRGEDMEYDEGQHIKSKKRKRKSPAKKKKSLRS